MWPEMRPRRLAQGSAGPSADAASAPARGMGAPVDITLFLPGLADIVPARLISGFNTQRPAGLPLLELRGRQSLRARHFQCGRFDIDMALGPAQAGEDVRAGWRMSESAALLAGHRATLLISVADRISGASGASGTSGAGAETGSSALPAQDNELDEPAFGPTPRLALRRGGWSDPALVTRRLMLALAHRVAWLAARQLDAGAVYWGQSGQLVPVAALDDPTAGDRLPTALCFVPLVFSSGGRFIGRRLTGFRAAGSQDLLGRMLIVHETALPLDRSTGYAAHMLRHCLDQGGLPAGNAVLRLPGWPEADIRLRPPSAADRLGTVEVMLRDDARAVTGAPGISLPDPAAPAAPAGPTLSNKPAPPSGDEALRRTFGRMLPGQAVSAGLRRFWSS